MRKAVSYFRAHPVVAVALVVGVVAVVYLVAAREGPPPQPAAAVGVDLSNASIEQLIWAANNHYERAQRLLREGDWAGYGAEMEALKATLDRLVALTGGLPTATPPEN